MDMTAQLAGILYKVGRQLSLYSETGRAVTAYRAAVRFRSLYARIWYDDMPPSAIIFSIGFGLLSSALDVWAIKISGFSNVPHRCDIAHFMILFASYFAAISDTCAGEYWAWGYLM